MAYVTPHKQKMYRKRNKLKKELLTREMARRSFGSYMSYLHPELEITAFHKTYYEILDLFAHGKIKHLAVSVPPQHGKLLCSKEPIKTANRGWVEHGQLVPGDIVFNPIGRQVKVLNNFGSYMWPCRKVTFAGGYSLIASYNHEWGCTVPNSSHKDIWHPRIETDEIWKTKTERNPYIKAMRGDKNVKKHTIVSIEDVGEVFGNCIQVEGGYYCAGKQMIPTHNSEGSTRNLPAYMHGINPDLRIGVISYAQPLARKFNKAIQANIMDKKFQKLFPGVYLPNTKEARAIGYDPSIYTRNANEYSIINRRGNMIAVGRGGAITGNRIDIGVLDDLYKDDSEANSITVRRGVEEWYKDVFRSRLHDNSQELIVFTRWHGDDIIGYLQQKAETGAIYPFHMIDDISIFEDPTKYNPNHWYCINFPAIQDKAPTPIDPRKKGDVLWPGRHGIEGLLQKKGLDPNNFECLYQGNPISSAGRLYFKDFKTYEEFPSADRIKGNYVQIDLADKGDDYLCSLAFSWCTDGLLYVRDLIYTQEDLETTEELIIQQIIKSKAKVGWTESQAGGATVARNIRKQLAARGHHCFINDYHQTTNKESKIISNNVNLLACMVFPKNWAMKYPVFWKHVTGFNKVFKSNQHDDGPDCLTEAYLNTLEGKHLDALTEL